ncbi:hypothetical protein LA080_005452 [Diaporthe eres]|nr:hypothetical protein LA080_005452 [Diaporthe eres]
MSPSFALNFKGPTATGTLTWLSTFRVSRAVVNSPASSHSLSNMSWGTPSLPRGRMNNQTAAAELFQCGCLLHRTLTYSGPSGDKKSHMTYKTRLPFEGSLIAMECLRLSNEVTTSYLVDYPWLKFDPYLHLDLMKYSGHRKYKADHHLLQQQHPNYHHFVALEWSETARLAPSIYFRLPATTDSDMCFIVHWHRACTVCGMEDVFSEEVVHCPTIKDLGLADGMMDCVAKNAIVSANAAPYVCDDCFEN